MSAYRDDYMSKMDAIKAAKDAAPTQIAYVEGEVLTSVVGEVVEEWPTSLTFRVVAEWYAPAHDIRIPKLCIVARRDGTRFTGSEWDLMHATFEAARVSDC